MIKTMVKLKRFTLLLLNNEVDLILPKFPEGQKNKRGIFSAIISGFVGLAFEGILSFLHNGRYKALCKAVSAVSLKTDIQRNKLMQLENTLVMFGVYNAETLERLVQTVHILHSRQTMYENLFAGKTSAAYKYYSQMHGKKGIQHCAINLMLYCCVIQILYIGKYSVFGVNPAMIAHTKKQHLTPTYFPYFLTSLL